MKLNRTTWLSLLVAAMLGGGVYGYELVRSRQESTQANASQAQHLFQLQAADIQKIVIDRSQQTLELVKTDDETNPWRLKQPDNAPADSGAVAFLLDLLVSGKPQRTFTVSPDRRAQYGLEQPIAKVTFVFSQGSQQIVLGQSGLNEETIYAELKSLENAASKTEVVLVSKNWQYAVERELAAWKSTSLAK